MELIKFEMLDEKELKPNVIAFSSLCANNKHILIWDFDISIRYSNQSKLEKILQSIKEYYGLSDIYLLLTTNGYNAICLSILSSEEITIVKKNTFLDDKKHLDFGLTNGGWNCRIGKDKKYVTTISSFSKQKYIKSNAHRIALEKFFNVKINKDKLFDESTNIKLEAYWCWKEVCENGRR